MKRRFDNEWEFRRAVKQVAGAVLPKKMPASVPDPAKAPPEKPVAPAPVPSVESTPMEPAETKPRVSLVPRLTEPQRREKRREARLAKQAELQLEVSRQILSLQRTLHDLVTRPAPPIVMPDAPPVAPRPTVFNFRVVKRNNKGYMEEAEIRMGYENG